MHPFLVIPLAGFLGACVVGAAVVARNQPSRLRSVSALLVGCAGAASALEVIWCSPAVPTSFAPVLMRLAGLCMLAVGPLCLELVCDRWPHFERRLRIPRVIAAGSAAGLGLLILETSRFVSEPLPTEWGFAMHGGTLMWIACLHTLACLFASTACLWEVNESEDPDERAQRHFAIGIASLIGAALLLDLILAAQSVPSPRLAGPILVFAAAAFWRPARAGEGALHPGAFDSDILDALSDGVAVLTDGGRIRAVNASLEALAQVPRQRLMNLELKELLIDPPEDASLRAQHETSLLSEGGESIPVSVSTSPLRDRQGSLIGCAVAIRDRREIVDLQRQLVVSARFAAVGELAAGLAHEVNNPLAFIQANLNQMQRDYSEFKCRLEGTSGGGESVLREGEQLIADCLEGIGRVASIVREVRGFAHGGDDLDRLCDVNAVLELAMRMACPPHRNAARVERRYAELPAIQCSEQDLKQLFLGLVMHAAQPSRKASNIRLVTEAHGQSVSVAIEDDGLGYSEQDMDRVFEPSFDESGGGASEGMGLSIAYHIAHQLGGEVEVESDPGGETRVGVVIPCGGDFDPLESTPRSRSQASSRTH